MLGQSFLVRGARQDDRNGDSDDGQREGPDELVVRHEATCRCQDVKEEPGMQLLIELVVASDHHLEHFHHRVDHLLIRHRQLLLRVDRGNESH